MKLLQIKDYLLFIDEEAEIKEEKLVVRVYEDDIMVSKSLPNSDNLKRLKDKRVFLLVAYYPLNKEAKPLDLPLLPPFEDDSKILGKKIVEYCKKYEGTDKYNDIMLAVEFGYHLMPPRKEFSLEDMKKAIGRAYKAGFDDTEDNWELSKVSNEIIQSLSTQQLPKEFIPEIEQYTQNLHKDIWYNRLKTITNSEGREVLVGTYKY